MRSPSIGIINAAMIISHKFILTFWLFSSLDEKGRYLSVLTLETLKIDFGHNTR